MGVPDAGFLATLIGLMGLGAFSLSPPVSERVLVLDQDEKTYAVLEESAKSLDITLQPMGDGVRQGDLRGQRYLLAFAAYPNDSFFDGDDHRIGTYRLVLLANASSKRKALDLVGPGIFGVLTKPFQPEEASAVIRGALEMQRVQRELSRPGTIEYLSESLMDKLRNIARKADPAKKGDLYGFVKRSIEKPLLEMVLEETGGNRIKAANVLGINRNTLRTKLKELGVETLRPARPRRKPTRR